MPHFFLDEAESPSDQAGLHLLACALVDELTGCSEQEVQARYIYQLQPLQSQNAGNISHLQITEQRTIFAFVLPGEGHHLPERGQIPAPVILVILPVALVAIVGVQRH